MNAKNDLKKALSVACITAMIVSTLSAFVAPMTVFADTTFVVNDNGDAGDATPGDGICATGGAVCTLRAAMEEAEAFEGTDTIEFNDLTVTATGDLYLGSDVTLTGNGVIDFNGLENLLFMWGGDYEISSSNVVVDGITIQNAGAGCIYTNANHLDFINNTVSTCNDGNNAVWGSGIDVEFIGNNVSDFGTAVAFSGGGNYTFSDNIIDGGDYGINLADADLITMTGNEVSNVTSLGLSVTDNTGVIWDVTIGGDTPEDGNTISMVDEDENSVGIKVLNSDAVIKNNILTSEEGGESPGVGIYVNPDSEVTIQGNSMIDFLDGGIYVTDGSATIGGAGEGEGNEVSWSNTSINVFGQSTITGNTVGLAAVGILLNIGSDGSTVEDNISGASDYGVLVFSAGNTISGNDFSGNTNGAVFSGAGVTDNAVIDCDLTDTMGGYGVDFRDGAEGDVNTVRNSNFTSSRVEEDGIINVQYDVRVYATEDDVGINDAEVTGPDALDMGVTGEDGYTEYFPIDAYTITSAGPGENPAQTFSAWSPTYGIDSADVVVETVDQTIELDDFELTSFTVDSAGASGDADPGDGICDNGDGDCTLRAAMEESNALLGTEIINFNDITTVAESNLLLTGDVVLTGNGVLDLDSTWGLYLEDSPMTHGAVDNVVINGITIQNGNTNCLQIVTDDLDDSGNALTVSGVTISGCTQWAISGNGNSVEVSGSNFSGWGADYAAIGLYFDSSDWIISGNTFTGVAGAPAVTVDTTGDGILIDDNDMIGGESGIAIWHTTGANITANTIDGATNNGIYMGGGSDVVIGGDLPEDGNIISNIVGGLNPVAIQVWPDAESATVSNNIVSSSGDDSWAGIVVYTSAESTINNNSVSNATIGFMIAGDDHTGTGNSVSDCTEGFYIDGANMEFSGSVISGATHYGLLFTGAGTTNNTFTNTEMSAVAQDVGFEDAEDGDVNYLNNTTFSEGSDSVYHFSEGDLAVIEVSYSGTVVVTNNGEPVSGATVSAVDANDDVVELGETDGDGVVSFSDFHSYDLAYDGINDLSEYPTTFTATDDTLGELEVSVLLDTMDEEVDMDYYEVPSFGYTGYYLSYSPLAVDDENYDTMYFFGSLAPYKISSIRSDSYNYSSLVDGVGNVDWGAVTFENDGHDSGYTILFDRSVYTNREMVVTIFDALVGMGYFDSYTIDYYSGPGGDEGEEGTDYIFGNGEGEDYTFSFPDYDGVTPSDNAIDPGWISYREGPTTPVPYYISFSPLAIGGVDYDTLMAYVDGFVTLATTINQEDGESLEYIDAGSNLDWAAIDAGGARYTLLLRRSYFSDINVLLEWMEQGGGLDGTVDYYSGPGGDEGEEGVDLITPNGEGEDFTFNFPTYDGVTPASSAVDPGYVSLTSQAGDDDDDDDEPSEGYYFSYSPLALDEVNYEWYLVLYPEEAPGLIMEDGDQVGAFVDGTEQLDWVAATVEGIPPGDSPFEGTEHFTILVPRSGYADLDAVNGLMAMLQAMIGADSYSIDYYSGPDGDEGEEGVDLIMPNGAGNDYTFNFPSHDGVTPSSGATDPGWIVYEYDAPVVDPYYASYTPLSLNGTDYDDYALVVFNDEDGGPIIVDSDNTEVTGVNPDDSYDWLLVDEVIGGQTFHVTWLLSRNLFADLTAVQAWIDFAVAEEAIDDYEIQYYSGPGGDTDGEALVVGTGEGRDFEFNIPSSDGEFTIAPAAGATSPGWFSHVPLTGYYTSYSPLNINGTDYSDVFAYEISEDEEAEIRIDNNRTIIDGTQTGFDWLALTIDIGEGEYMRITLLTSRESFPDYESVDAWISGMGLPAEYTIDYYSGPGGDTDGTLLVEGNGEGNDFTFNFPESVGDLTITPAAGATVPGWLSVLQGSPESGDDDDVPADDDDDDGGGSGGYIGDDDTSDDDDDYVVVGGDDDVSADDDDIVADDDDDFGDDVVAADDDSDDDGDDDVVDVIDDYESGEHGSPDEDDVGELIPDVSPEDGGEDIVDILDGGDATDEQKQAVEEMVNRSYGSYFGSSRVKVIFGRLYTEKEIADMTKEAEENGQTVLVLDEQSDYDNDGIPDILSIAYGYPLFNEDADGDGLTNADELFLGTDPYKADTDFTLPWVTNMDGFTVGNMPSFRVAGLVGDEVELFLIPADSYDGSNDDFVEDMSLGKVIIDEGHKGELTARYSIPNGTYYVVPKGGKGYGEAAKFNVDSAVDKDVGRPEIFGIENGTAGDGTNIPAGFYVAFVLDIVEKASDGTFNADTYIAQFSPAGQNYQLINGKSKPGHRVFITLKSVIFSSVAIADANGDFVVKVPQSKVDLANEEHNLTVYSENSSNQVSSALNMKFYKFQPVK